MFFISYPLTAPAERPEMKNWFPKPYATSTGNSAITEPASIRFHCVAAPELLFSAIKPTMRVCWDGNDTVKMVGIRYSFQDAWKDSIPTVASIGNSRGIMIL